MPTSAPGNSGLRCARRRASRGFTLIEVMVVVALVAVAAGVVSLALRDGTEGRLEREAVRLSTLLETARAEARASALPVLWMLTPESNEHQFRFVGLPESRALPMRWLDPGIVARIDGTRGALVLGPEALIGAQRVVLSIDQHVLAIGTDGLRPFAVQASDGRTP